MTPSRRDFLRTSAFAAGSMALFAACSPADEGTAAPTPGGSPSPGPESPAPVVADSWAPAPLEVDGLSMVATQRGEELTIATIDGERTFWAGVGLTAALPGHAASEFAATAEDYRRWFSLMAEVGVRVVRLDRLQAPELYAELRRHNETHPDAPLYVVQGVCPPELEAVAEGEPLSAAVRAAMTREIEHTSAAVHGDLTREDAVPSGTWTADVSGWVVGWLVGFTWNPTVVLATDRGAPDTPPYQGTYFSSTVDASATETWLASCMDALATREAAAGTSAPIAAANWPTTDPLAHPEEPIERDDLVGVDVNHITVTPSWPGGTFAAYQAFPFKPHFLRRQPSYEGDDPYRSYLLDLKRYHRGLPLLVTEFGVPASLGQSHVGTNGRDDGHHSEQEAMSMNADMLRMFHGIGLAGGLLVSWTDDWSATAPATARREVGVSLDQRLLWHDPLTSSQWHGLLAHDPEPAGERIVHDAPEDEMTRVTVDHDTSYLYMTFSFTRRVTSPVDVGFDLLPQEEGLRLPGGSGARRFDVAIHLTPTMSTVNMFVRRILDPVRLDALPSIYLPRANSRGWVKEQLVVRPPLQSPGERTTPAEMLTVGEMVLGTWNPESPAFTSLATWQLVRPDPLRPMEWRLRLPWSMLLFADPAGGRIVVPDLGEPRYIDVERMQVVIESSTPGSPASFAVDLPRWDAVPPTTERLRAGVRTLTDAFAEVTG
ncbi:MAG: twin-arginine translocation signal domain-containing protein [Mobilicoccus sp.]|nr:twin-arginine translocation signal domain-containing protein [Mobilicoccus sp.]